MSLFCGENVFKPLSFCNLWLFFLSSDSVIFIFLPYWIILNKKNITQRFKEICQQVSICWSTHSEHEQVDIDGTVLRETNLGGSKRHSDSSSTNHRGCCAGGGRENKMQLGGLVPGKSQHRCCWVIYAPPKHTFAFSSSALVFVNLLENGGVSRRNQVKIES